MPVNGTDKTMYVLLISINPGAPLGGSIAEYFPGTFNGTHFQAVDGVTRIADFGKDNYAGQFFYGVPSGSDAVSIAWASNWQYTQLVPSGPLEGWRSAMSLPRRNYLANITRVGWDMVSTPYDLSPVIGRTLASHPSLGNITMHVDYSTAWSNAVCLEINVSNIDALILGSDATVNFTFRSPISDEYVRGGFYFAGDQNFFLDRGGVRGFDNVFFTDKFSTTDVISQDGMWSLVVIFDRSILEVFLDGGTRSATNVFYPQQPLTELVIQTAGIKGDMQIGVTIKSLESAWVQYEDESGVVAGNVSTAGTSIKSKQHMVDKAEL
jgi:beta-fructofuranosidase